MTSACQSILVSRATLETQRKNYCFLGSAILQLIHQQNGWTVFSLEIDFPVFLPVYVYTEEARHYVLISTNYKSFYAQDINGLNTYMELHILFFKGWMRR